MGGLKSYTLQALAAIVLSSATPNNASATTSGHLGSRLVNPPSVSSPLEYITLKADANSHLLSASNEIAAGKYQKAIESLQKGFDSYQRIKKIDGDVQYANFLLSLGENCYKVLIELDENSQDIEQVVTATEKNFHLAGKEYDNLIARFPELKQDPGTGAFYSEVWAGLTNFYKTIGYFEKAFRSCITLLMFRPSEKNLKVLTVIGSKVPQEVIENGKPLLKSLVGADKADQIFEQIEANRE